MGSVKLLRAETGALSGTVMSGLSGDRFCFLTSTGAPELSQPVQFSYNVAFSAAAFVAKVRNLRAGKQSPIYAKTTNHPSPYIPKSMEFYSPYWTSNKQNIKKNPVQLRV